MKQKKISTNAIVLLCLTLLLSTTNFAQLICELGERDHFYQSQFSEEYSGLAYYPKDKIFLMATDGPVRGETNIYIKAYNSVTKALLNVSFSNIEEFTAFDFEGLTHLKDDYFVLLEEDENKIYFLEYMNSDPNNPQFKVLSGHATGIPLANNDPEEPDGLEGTSYDPNTGRLYLVREWFDIRLFSVPLTLPGKDPVTGLVSLGDIEEEVQETSNVELNINLDAAGLFHLGQIYPDGHALSNNILVLSKYTNTMWEFSLSLDDYKNLTANSLTLFKEMPLDEPKAEGVVVVDQKIYITSESSVGGLSSYNFKTENGSCNDNNANTINDSYNANCNCAGVLPMPGCTDETACNYQASATVENNSCTYPQPNFNCEGDCLVIGNSCNNGNGTYNENCICIDKPACVADIVVNSNIVNGGTSLQNLYESSETIETAVVRPIGVDVVIRNEESVNLKSSFIKLNEGFAVEAGGCLDAEIEPCE